MSTIARLAGCAPRSGRGPCAVLVLSAVLLPWAAAQAEDTSNCLWCHQYRGLSRYDAPSEHLFLYFVKPEYTYDRLGPHARLACTDCHNATDVSVIPHQPVTRVDCTRECHLRDPDGVERRFSHTPIVEFLRQSVHDPNKLATLDFSGGPVLATNQSACLYCHDEPVFRDPTGAIPALAAAGSGVFDRCDVCHSNSGQLPSDVAYYVRHIAGRLRTTRPPLEMAQVCAVCHSDAKINAKFGMHDAVASYVRSFHGKAALLGYDRAADCVSCHVARHSNAHRMLGPQDAASSVNEKHRADTCRSYGCHPGADPGLASAGVHLDLPTVRGTWEYLLAAAFILLTVFTFGPSMLIVVLELCGLVVGREHHGSRQMRALAERVLAVPEGQRLLTRFTVSQRFQHWILAVLFTLLALTGFPMKFADRHWARVVVDAFGGLATARQVHHWAGLSLCVGFAAHALYVLTGVLRRRRQAHAAGRKLTLAQGMLDLPMWVGPADALKMLHLLLYQFGLRKHPPTFGRFTVKEKFEYIGVFWGTTLLGLTGALLWGQAYASHLVNGRVLNLALIAHTYEAFLAIIHVGILHIINVILKPSVFPLSPATITGRTPLTELADEHAEQVLDAARRLGLATEGVPADE